MAAQADSAQGQTVQLKSFKSVAKNDGSSECDKVAEYWQYAFATGVDTPLFEDGSSECDEAAECWIDTFATSVKTPLATNDPMMTSVRLEGVGVAKFECDTAASHSVISAEVFDKLQQLLKKKLCVKPENVSIRLADGTLSDKSCGSVQLAVEKAIPGRGHRLKSYATPVRLSFFVVAGPNCLLGRYALEQLWPAEYQALRNVASIGSTELTRAWACTQESWNSC